MKNLIIGMITFIVIGIGCQASINQTEALSQIMRTLSTISVADNFLDFKVVNLTFDVLSKGKTYVQTRLCYSGVTYLIAGHGLDGITDLDIVVYNESGTEVTKDLKNDNNPSVCFTADRTQTYTIKTTAYAIESSKESQDNAFCCSIAFKP